jgi:hypothetical protein
LIVCDEKDVGGTILRTFLSLDKISGRKMVALEMMQFILEFYRSLTRIFVFMPFYISFDLGYQFWGQGFLWQQLALVKISCHDARRVCGKRERTAICLRFAAFSGRDV